MKKVSLLNNPKEAIEISAKVIKEGGMVLFPTDTVYILAVDPTNRRSVEKLLGFKNRWTGKAISVAVADKAMAKEYVVLNDKAESLYDKLLPGPFTIVSEGKHKVASGIEAENGTLGIRIPDNKYVLELVKAAGVPVTATSANLSGRSPHYSVDSFWKTLSDKKKGMIDLVADAGRLPINKPSTVIDVTESEIKILRRGDLITGQKETLVSKSEAETEKIAEFILRRVLKNETTKPVVIGLSGDLGTGKTVFSRAVGRRLGVTEKITSPTFTIYNEYDLSRAENKYRKFLHFDLYRLSEQFEYEELKFFDLFEEGVLACVEWPENMGQENFERLKKETEYVAVNFEYRDDSTREVSYSVK